MYTQEWLPFALNIQEETPSASLDVLVKMSEDQKIMGMYVVNSGPKSQTRTLELSGFVPEEQASVTQLGPYPLDSRNSRENTDFISPVTTKVKIGENGFQHQFPVLGSSGDTMR